MKRTAEKSSNKQNLLKEKQQQKEAEVQSDQHNQILNNLIEQNFAKPTNVEAQRIIKIIDELLSNMEILQYLDSEFISGFHNLEIMQELFGTQTEALSESVVKLLSF